LIQIVVEYCWDSLRVLRLSLVDRLRSDFLKLFQRCVPLKMWTVEKLTL
jgi:hypothetical protein